MRNDVIDIVCLSGWLANILENIYYQTNPVRVKESVLEPTDAAEIVTGNLLIPSDWILFVD